MVYVCYIDAAAATALCALNAVKKVCPPSYIIHKHAHSDAATGWKQIESAFFNRCTTLNVHRIDIGNDSSSSDGSNSSGASVRETVRKWKAFHWQFFPPAKPYDSLTMHSAHPHTQSVWREQKSERKHTPSGTSSLSNRWWFACFGITVHHSSAHNSVLQQTRIYSDELVRLIVVVCFYFDLLFFIIWFTNSEIVACALRHINTHTHSVFSNSTNYTDCIYSFTISL